MWKMILQKFWEVQCLRGTHLWAATTHPFPRPKRYERKKYMLSSYMSWIRGTIIRLCRSCINSLLPLPPEKKLAALLKGVGIWRDEMNLLLNCSPSTTTASYAKCMHARNQDQWCLCCWRQGSIKVKVTVEVYSLVSSAKRYSPDFTQLTPWSQDLFIHKPSQLPRDHTARVPFLAHGTIQTHKLSLSYQVPTYSWVERVHV